MKSNFCIWFLQIFSASSLTTCLKGIRADKFGESLHGVTSPRSPALEPDVSDLVRELCRLRLGSKDNEDGGKTPCKLLVSWPDTDPPETSSDEDSEPISSRDDSSATPLCSLTN